MPVTCQICKREFATQINNRHLSTAHGMTTIEYKARYGVDSLSSPEYRERISNARKGENNPNYGNAWTDDKKSKLSEKVSGREAHNKGYTHTEEAKKRMSELAKNRYTNSTHPLSGTTVSDETKRKISQSVKKYAAANPAKMSDRSVRAYATRAAVGTQVSMSGLTHTDESKFMISKSNREVHSGRKEGRAEDILLNISLNHVLISHDDWKYFNVKCNHCEKELVLTRQNFTKSKFKTQPCAWCVQNTSLAEREIFDFIQSLGFVVYGSDKTAIYPHEVDMYVPSHQLAIEFDGLYWHSDLAGKSKDYHLDKTKRCAAVGIKLIHIFEDEYTTTPDIVRSRIKNALGVVGSKINARECSVVELDSKTANAFLNANHLQGAGRSNIRYGLEYDHRLVAVMTFNDSNPSRKGTEWEINRFASLADHALTGGGSKLFSHFVDHVKPYRVVSFADRRWGDGDFYAKLGFAHVSDSPPNYWYFLTSDNSVRYHRYNFRKSVLVSNGYDATKTEAQIMKERGFGKIWDCGHSKWVWNALQGN